MKVTLAQAKSTMARFGVNSKVIPPKLFQAAMNIEMEHGRRPRQSSKCPKVLLDKVSTNVTNNSLEKTAKIVLAHLIEFPTYYQELIKMEARLSA
jgi:hypothetical protein